ncbi:MAG: PAS domain S-box protein [Thermodesulfovibrionales bacterium]|nr:PAS domain S-box protein [Thermodesulfovibrionales bacterium]
MNLKNLMHIASKTVIILILTIPLVIATSTQVQCDDVIKKKQVLVLNSYHKGLSWTDNIVRGIESAFANHMANLEIDFEYMDTKRYYDESYFTLLYKTFRKKYEDKLFDVIIVSDNDALMFALKYRKDIFKNAPIVFTGINNFTDSMIEGHKNITGVVEETDPFRTIQIALQLFPKTREILVINDRTTTGIAMKEEIQKVIDHFQNAVDFTFYDDFDITDIPKRVSNLPPDTLILLVVVNRDKSGNFFAYEESLSVIYKYTNVPIFSFWDFYLGKGIVGGMLTSAFLQGKTAGSLALRILNGEDISNIQIVRKSPNQYMFDYNELKRFKALSSLIPKEAIIINTPDTFFSRHKTVILWSMAAIIFLSTIILVLSINMIKRKKVEEALRISEEKYRDLYDNAPDMYHSVDANGIIVECNDTELKMLGYTKEELIGKPITFIFTEESAKQHERDFPMIKQQRAVFGLERNIVKKDGTVFPAVLNVFVEYDSDGNMKKTKTIMRDMTLQKSIENDLRHSQEVLQSLSSHLQTVRDDERRYIANEIHDELGQMLTALKLDITWLRKKVEENGDGSYLMDLDDIINLTNETIKTVQRISSELRPGVLEHLGLISALEWQIEEYKKRSNIEFVSQLPSFDISIDEKKSTAIFRIFQEAMTNIIRHSQATRAQVSLYVRDNTIYLDIQDNGCGISEDSLNNPSSFGIIGIRERVRFLGGQVTFEGIQNEGTRVSVTIPI